MYDYIKGNYEGIHKDYLSVENAGIGYKVFTSGNTMSLLPDIGEKVTLFLTQIVRQDFIGLYGFYTREELDLFLVLIKINGVGPKAALSLLSVSSPERLKRGIINKDEKLLTKAPGIGKKISQRIILELKGKLTLEESDDLTEIEKLSIASDKNVRESIDALMALGYSEREAEKAVSSVDKNLSIEDIIKSSLKNLMN
ncbi:MAG: Holliday junction branch migration protein RuvA [Clostridium sp.]|nr:Holliday junction branch migration protein RuvA [Clostridium sp.]